MSRFKGFDDDDNDDDTPSVPIPSQSELAPSQLDTAPSGGRPQRQSVGFVTSFVDNVINGCRTALLTSTLRRM